MSSVAKTAHRQRTQQRMAEVVEHGRDLPILAEEMPDVPLASAEATTRRLAGMGLLTVLLLLGSIALGGLLGDYAMRPHMPMSAMPAMGMPPAHPASHSQTPMAMPSAAPQQTPMSMP